MQQAFDKLAAEAVRGKPSKLGAGHDCSPSLSSIVESFKREGNEDRAMLLALLQAKKAEDERLTALSYALAVQALSVAAASQGFTPETPGPAIERMPSTGSSVVSSRQSDRSSPSDNESVATTVSSGPEKSSSRQAKPSSRKRKLSSVPVPDSTPPCHATVMSALRDKLSARSPGSASQPLQSPAQPPVKRQRAASNLSNRSVEATSSPRLLPQESNSAPRRLYTLPLSQGFTALKPPAVATGPTESEKFRASLNLLNIAAERDSMRETVAGTLWQTSDVRGE